MSEEWRAIAGFEHYEVSNLGRVRSWRRRARGGIAKEPRQRKLVPDKDGYMRVGLERGDGRQAKLYVHNLVLEAFKAPRPDGLQCRHLDGSTDNNTPGNLEWSTPLVNSRDKQAHGTQCRGRDIYLAKLDEETVRAMRAADGKLKDIAKAFGVHVATVSKVRKRQSWAWVD